MKNLLFFFLFITALFANETNEKSTFIDDVLKEVTQTLDSNITNKVKLENVKEYLSNLEFNDEVDTKKYKLNLMGHYENFILVAGHSSSNLYERHWTNGVEDTNTNGYKRDTNEAQFQISIKTPLYSDFLATGADLFVAYTQNSYWQMYDRAHSSPFRETNYMPELFLEWQPEKKLGDSILKQVRFALIHQSNGQDIGASRSWNRSEIFFHLENNNINYGMHIWDRWDEDDKPNVQSPEGDDNVGLEDYIGNQRYFVKYKNDDFTLMLTHQNDIIEYDINKGNSKIDLTFPSPNKNFDFFIRYFTGYGESLIDYDVKVERISFGIMIANWI